MSPEDLAILHSQVIDVKIKAVSDSYVVLNNAINSELDKIFTGLVMNENGTCSNCRENRMLMNKAVSLIRTKLKEHKEVLAKIYTDGDNQINQLATNYIQWLREQ